MTNKTQDTGDVKKGTFLREKVEWWRYLLSWVFYCIAIVGIILMLISLTIELIWRSICGLTGYFTNPKEKRNFKDGWLSVWDNWGKL